MADGNISIGDLVFRMDPLTKKRFITVSKVIAIEDWSCGDVNRKRCVGRLSNGDWDFVWNLISLEEVRLAEMS